MQSITITLKLITISIAIAVVLKHPQKENKIHLHGLMKVYFQTTRDMNCCNKCNYESLRTKHRKKAKNHINWPLDRLQSSTAALCIFSFETEWAGISIHLRICLLHQKSTVKKTSLVSLNFF